MTDSPRGLPLLSGPPPEPPLNERPDASCRKCNKEFNILFARGRRCNHCGYSYCYSCSDYQALMPRTGNDAGYDRMAVCAFCIQYLQITVGGKGYLRSLPLSRLKNYMQAYGLKLGADVLEKDDIINAIIAARTSNGCLPRSNENYYRKYSVPSGQASRPRGLFSRSERAEPRQHLDPRTGWTRSYYFARPDLQTDHPTGGNSETRHQRNANEELGQSEQRRQGTRNQYSPPPGPPPFATYTSAHYGAYPNSNAPHPQSNPQYSYPQYHYPGNTPYMSPPPNPNTTHSPNRTQSVPPPHRPATAPPPRHSPPRPHVPTLDELLQIPEEEIPSLTVSVLKEILEINHVRVGIVLEKSELVARVNALVTAERRERVRAEAVREREEWEAREREWATRERERGAQEAREQAARDEEEMRQRREAYRTTVESGSESDDGSRNNLEQPRSESPSAKEVQKEDGAKPVDPSRSPSPTPSRTLAERSGLCVVCQDEEANIVVIDCGHLALCRGCSDLVWSSTRECPLCRTRIVTQARFLRVFKA